MHQVVESEFRQFVRSFLTAYFKQDQTKLTALVTRECVFYEAAEKDSFHWLAESEHLDVCDYLQMQGSFTKLAEDLYLYTGILHFMPIFQTSAEDVMQSRVTILAQYRTGAFQCMHFHVSLPALMKGPDYGNKVSYYLEQLDYRKLEQSFRQLQVVLSNIPGGIKVSRDDETYSFLYVSEELCALFGYTNEEYMKATGGTAVGGVYPPDRERALAEAQAAFQNGSPDYAVKYRVLCKDGTLKWIIDSGKKVEDEDGNRIINSLYLDVTEIENANQKISEQKELLEKERERFRIAVDNTLVVIFEYDINADVYIGYGTLEEADESKGRGHTEQVIEHFLETHAQELVKPADAPALARLLLGTAGREAEMELRLRKGNPNIIWARITVTPVVDEEKRITKMIGKITNIQSEKEKEFALIETNSRDRLTKLYNKETGLRMVQSYMEQKDPKEICAMMLLDMDDFSRVNEREGTVFADALLQEVAEILRAQTSREDVQIRLGGDEFMLFVKNCDKARASVLGPQIAKRIQELSFQENENLRVSASIGMCVTAVVDEYSGLYRCAESTLKYVKENKKGEAACYLDSSNELGTMLTQVYTEKHFINAIDRMASPQEDNLVSFALELLGKSKNLDDALFLLLARIGRTCQLDRVSILEVDQEYLSYRFTYQWAKNQGDLEMDRAFYLNRDEMEAVGSLYDEEGVSSSPLSSQSPWAFSCLHAAIWDHGSYAGSLSFEIREESMHVWPESQRKLLQELTRIVASFILKERADAVSRAKTDFLSRMSHEIRTPMNAITGMTAIAKSVLADREKTLDCLNKIESANAYLLGLINDILDMSRIESGKVELNMENVDLVELIGRLETLLRPQAETKGLRFLVKTELHSGRWVMADALRLNQVLVNLIGNAVKFTNRGGEVTLHVEELSATGEFIGLLFSVQDTGIGIRREALDKIFNVFEQADRNTASSYGGTGLGLAISSRLVQMMGGTLEVSSRFGQGSDFYFTLCLPVAAPQSFLPIKSKPVCSEPAMDLLRDMRILVVEDNELNREIAESILSMRGVQVDTAENGREALQAFSSYPAGYYDAILMDIRMPVMDGLEATRRIRIMGREDSRSIPIIAMTANAFDEDMRSSIDSGMNGHLSKPIEIELLIHTIERCVSSRACSSPEQTGFNVNSTI